MALLKIRDEDFVEKLHSLGKEKQLLFGLLTCSRMLQCVRNFDLDEHTHIAPVFEGCLDLVCTFLIGKSEYCPSMQEAHRACREVIPDGDESESVYLDAAQECGFSVQLLLEFAGDGDLCKILRIRSFAIDSAVGKADEDSELHPSDRKGEADLVRHEIVQSELAIQRNELDVIENLGRVEAETIDMICSKYR